MEKKKKIVVVVAWQKNLSQNPYRTLEIMTGTEAATQVSFLCVSPCFGFPTSFHHHFFVSASLFHRMPLFNFLFIPHILLFLPTLTPARQGGNHITQQTRAKQLNCSNCGLYHIEIQLFWEDTVTICEGENFLQAQN